MKIPSAERRLGVEINMTPMIDVVFLLIIFFLVSSHLAQQETQLDLDLPVAESGRRPDLGDDVRVTINVLPEGQTMLGGIVVDPSELGGRLQYEAQKAVKAGVDLNVRIRCARMAPYEFIEPILVSCARSGIWNITFAVVRKTC